MKKLLRIVALIGLLLVGIFLLLRYVLFPIVPVEHLYDDIPDGADHVLLVDTEELLSLTFSEILSSPSAGNPFDDDEDEEEDDVYDIQKVLRKGLWNGLEIPDQLIIYQNETGDQPLIVLLPLSDSLEFQSFLEDIQDKSLFVEQAPGTWADSSHTLLLGSDYLKLCLGIAESQRDLKKEKGNWKEELKSHEDGSIATSFATTAQQSLSTSKLYSEAGGLRLVYSSQDVLPFEATGQSNHAKAWLSLQVGPDDAKRAELLKGKSKLNKVLRNAGLDPFALETIWDGRFQLCIAGLKSIEEEVVTYTFNDDFEKVEQRELKQRTEADFNAFFGLKQASDSMFYHKSWVKNVDGEDLFVNYPMQEVSFQEEEGRIRFSSKEAEQRDCIDSPGDGQFLAIDFEALESEWNLQGDSTKQLELGLSTLTANRSADGLEVNVLLRFQDADRQGIFSMLDSPLLEEGFVKSSR